MTVLYFKTHETVPEIPKNGSAATAVHIPARTLKYRYLLHICHIPKLVALQPRANVGSWPYIYPHLVDVYGKCTKIHHTWMLWELHLTHTIVGFLKILCRDLIGSLLQMNLNMILIWLAWWLWNTTKEHIISFISSHMIAKKTNMWANDQNHSWMLVLDTSNVYYSCFRTAGPMILTCKHARSPPSQRNGYQCLHIICVTPKSSIKSTTLGITCSPKHLQQYFFIGK